MPAQFLTDDTGNKVAVVIPVEDYEELLEDLQDAAIIAERRGEERLPFEEVKRKFQEDGLLPS